MQATNNPPPSTPSFQIPDYVLDDLCSRFIINIPEEERQDLIRVFFQIELAHWFYLDFYCAENQELKTCGIKDFSAQIFHHCPSLSGHAQELDMILGNWKSYKMSVPTYGAILLDPDMRYCLLVQGFWAKASWGFPKGKVNASEPPDECAIREVYEETGFDVTKQINKDEFLENKMNDQVTRLYIIRNVPLDTKFQPKTRKEIKNLQWFPIDALPAHKRDQTSKTQLGLNPNTFFMVIPFVKPLKKWVSSQGGGQSQASSSSSSSAAVSGAAAAAGGKQPPRPKSSTNKDSNDIQNNKQQHRDKQRQMQQQYFAQSNQNEFQEFMHIKETKGRQKDTRDRNAKIGSQAQTANQSVAPVYSSPAFKQDKRQQFQILNRDGTVNGKPRRSLATQFENQESPQQAPQYQRGGKHNKHDRRQKGSETRSDIFIPQAWANFKFDVNAIMAAIG